MLKSLVTTLGAKRSSSLRRKDSATSLNMPELEDNLESMGLSQYLQPFRDEGFDTWSTLMDITESDLDALGVKLGHRRRLQRAIVEARGHTKDHFPLEGGQGARVKGSHDSDEASPEQDQKNASDTPGSDMPLRKQLPPAKRKYRRHPKPDDNAPERPPSAYVIFSNRMREVLRGKELSFTDIAKIVGERWQELSPEDKEPYESQAQGLKEKYYRELADYKKTEDFASYQDYLVDFKARHGQPNGQDTKRLKTESDMVTSPRMAEPVKAGLESSVKDEYQNGRSNRTPMSPSSPTSTHDSTVEGQGPPTASVLHWRSGFESPMSPNKSPSAISPQAQAFQRLLPPPTAPEETSWTSDCTNSRHRALPMHGSAHSSISSQSLHNYSLNSSTHASGSLDSRSRRTSMTSQYSQDRASRPPYPERPPSSAWTPGVFALPPLDVSKSGLGRILPPPASLANGVSYGTHASGRPVTNSEYQNRHSNHPPESPNSRSHVTGFRPQPEPLDTGAKTSLATLLSASEAVERDAHRQSHD